MRIAIATDNGLVSAHFGRCQSYTIADIEEGTVVNVENISNPGHRPGFLPQYLAERGVKIMIAGGMGQRARTIFEEYGIEVITGIQGSVDETIRSFAKGQIQPGEDLCQHDSEHHHHHHHHHEENTNLNSRETTVPAGKICVVSKGPNLDSEVDEVFGRAAYFIFVDPETSKFEAYGNMAVDQAHGAGIQSAQLMVDRGVSTVVTAGQVGPNALRVLEAAGIQVLTIKSRTVREALDRLKKPDSGQEA